MLYLFLPYNRENKIVVCIYLANKTCVWRAGLISRLNGTWRKFESTFRYCLRFMGSQSLRALLPIVCIKKGLSDLCVNTVWWTCLSNTGRRWRLSLISLTVLLLCLVNKFTSFNDKFPSWEYHINTVQGPFYLSMSLRQGKCHKYFLKIKT